MKALLVADDEKAINNISEVLKSAGYDTIVYKWLLKALDNIEEIAPHLIVVSTGDYPRHWKTLAQYSTIGFGDYKPQIILYTDENFSEEEHEKAEALKVRGTFDSVEVEGLDKLREILKKTDDIFSGYLTEEEQAEISVDDLVPNARKYFEAKIKDAEDLEKEEIVEETEEIEEPVEEESLENEESIEEDEILEETEETDEPVEEETEPEVAEEGIEEETLDDEEILEETEDSVEEELPKNEETIEDDEILEDTEEIAAPPEEESFEEEEIQEEFTEAEVSDEEETFDDLVTKFEETNEENEVNEPAPLQSDETENDEAAADRLEEIVEDELAADRLEEIAEDELAADRLEEIADDELAADKLVRIAENEELSEDEEVMTVDALMSEPYDESESTELPGVEELKKLLEENNFEESENNAIIEETVEETQETEDGENTMADEQSIDEKLAAIMNANKADQKEKAEALKLDTSTSSVSFVFTNPITLAMVSGVARNYNGLVLEFTPDIPNFIMNLSPGTKIDIASMKIDDKIENVFAEVMSNDAKKLALAIKKIS